MVHQKTATPDFDPGRFRGRVLAVPAFLFLVSIMMIKLNHKGVRAYMATGGAQYRLKPDWQNRFGKIVKYSRDRSLAYVVWNGNRSFDRISVGLIEPADPERIFAQHGGVIATS